MQKSEMEKQNKRINSNSWRACPLSWCQTQELSYVIRMREHLFLFAQLKVGSAIPGNHIFSLSWV